MNKIDPKITAAKVYPIDPVDRMPEAYDEEDYPDPELLPMNFFDKVAGVVGAAFICLLIVYALL